MPGITGSVVNGGSSIEIALSVHDSVYSTDFASACIPYNRNESDKSAAEIEKHIVQTLNKKHLCKLLGAGVTLALLKEVRNCSQPPFNSYADPWVCSVSELVHKAVVGHGCSPNIKTYLTDSLAKPNTKLRFSSATGSSQVTPGTYTPGVRMEQISIVAVTDPTQAESKLPIVRTLDEQADSAARKCVCPLLSCAFIHLYFIGLCISDQEITRGWRLDLLTKLR